jgi:hypothetical protein
MLRGGSLADNPLIAKDLRTRKCRDAAGYVGYVGIRQLIFGLAALLCGIIGLIYDFTGLLGGIVYYICFAFCLIVFLWYCIVIRKATKKFW